MRIGVCTTDFAKPMPADTLFSRMREMGFSTTQLAFCSVEECAYTAGEHIEIPSSVSDAAIDAIRAAARRYDIDIIAVNGTFNMAHPDACVRAEGLKRMEGFLDAVCALGAPIVSLCSGSRSPEGLWRWDATTGDESAWKDMAECMTRCVKMAEKRGVTLAIETEAANVIDTPERARRILDEVGSDHLKMILDCANLFHAGEAKPENARPALDRAMRCFGRDIVLAHGKDIRPGPGIDFCATGSGLVDYPYMLTLLREAGYTGDMALHGIYDESRMPGCAQYMRRCMAEAGVSEQ